MIITLDFGGTKALYTLWDNGLYPPGQLERQKLPSSSVSDPAKSLLSFAKGHPIEAACIALAGPIRGDTFQMTNQHHLLQLSKLRQTLSSIPQVTFINDLEALGYGIAALGEDQLRLFRPGRAGSGPKAVLSLGTGLGVAAVIKDDQVLASEGGHMDFAPTNDVQLSLLAALTQKYDHVSYERLLSGNGIVDIYDALLGRPGGLSPELLSAKGLEPNAEPIVQKLFTVYTEILAAAAGNLALTFSATGGIYLGGGITPKLLPLLNREVFENAFLKKGRFNSFLKEIPVYVITDGTAPSLGAAVYAARKIKR